MENKKVMERYALAFFLDEDLKSIEKEQEGIVKFIELIKSDDDALRFFASPTFSKKEKYALIDSLHEKKLLSLKLKNFLKVIIKSHRGFYLLPILEETIDKANTLLKVKVVRCYLAMDITNKQKNALKSALEKKYECRIEIKYIIDPTLIGGLKIFVDDTLIDGSILTSNKELKKQVMGG